MSTLEQTASLAHLSLEQGMQIRQAVAGLSLCHSEAPVALQTPKRLKSFVKSERGHTYEIVSANQTGRTLKYLADIFKRDMKFSARHDHRQFNHRLISEDADDAPMFSDDLLLEPEKLLADGHMGESTWASYCLFARNERGSIVALSRFSLSVDVFEEGPVDFDATLSQGQPDDFNWDDYRNLFLTIDFDFIYTRSRFRGRGAGSALIAAMDEVIETELTHLCHQLAPVHAATGVTFKVTPVVNAALCSRSGEMAHNLFMENLEVTLEHHDWLASDGDLSRQAVVVCDALDEACY